LIGSMGIVGHIEYDACIRSVNKVDHSKLGKKRTENEEGRRA